MLEVKDLKVAYGRVLAVKGISFKVDQGQVVTLLGTNGAGKTTTLRTISGLIRPESGEIWFEGDRIDATPGTSGAHPGLGAFARGAQDLPAAYRRGEPDARRLRAQRPEWRGAGSGTGLQSLRHLAGETLPAGRYVLRRRAADAGNRASDDEPAQAADARRAIDGPLAADDAAHHVDHRRTAVRRCDDPARRAERSRRRSRSPTTAMSWKSARSCWRTPARRCSSMRTSARPISARTEAPFLCSQSPDLPCLPHSSRPKRVLLSRQGRFPTLAIRGLVVQCLHAN